MELKYMYKFTIDGQVEETDTPVLTGAQLRAYSSYIEIHREDLIDVDREGYTPIEDSEFVVVEGRRFIHCPKGGYHRPGGFHK